MEQSNNTPILSASDDAVFVIDNPDEASAELLVCEHASKYIPLGIDNLGLDTHTANGHVAWDPDALAVTEHLSGSLDATSIAANVFWLAYGCNCPPESVGATPAKSETFLIAGNRKNHALDTLRIPAGIV